MLKKHYLLLYIKDNEVAIYHIRISQLVVIWIITIDKYYCRKKIESGFHYFTKAELGGNQCACSTVFT